ncbi:metallophosphoesterase [Candidatus Woesearchaeota archaeon]|nr:metallophosphoesterase [Candidatus Woesearchaeota archaeon]
MKLVVLGDIHGKWKRVNAIINHELDKGFALSTGDLGNYKFEPENRQKIIFCHGNHESFQYIKELMEDKSNNLIPLKAGEIYTLSDGTTITALPGVFSPKFYEKGCILKYFSKADVEKLLCLEKKIDILLTHEAPFGIGVTKNGFDLGKEQINQIIKHLNPRIGFFGHHHFFCDKYLNTTRIIGLDQPNHSYILLDTETFTPKIIQASLQNRLGYQYKWERKEI